MFLVALLHCSHRTALGDDRRQQRRIIIVLPPPYLPGQLDKTGIAAETVRCSLVFRYLSPLLFAGPFPIGDYVEFYPTR